MRVSEFYEGPYVSLGERADSILRSKMVDYAGETQFSGNFRRAATSLGLTPLQVWGVFADKHWGAITAFIRNGRVESESIIDRLADLINYLHLLHGIIVEEGLVEVETEDRTAPTHI